MALYTVTELFGASVTSLQVWKSTNNGLSFAELDSANRANSNTAVDPRPGGYYKLNSSFLLFVIANGTTGFKRCITFNLTTGQWGTYTPDSPAGTNVGAWVTWRPNGDYVLVYPRAGLVWFSVFSIASQTWTEFPFIPSGGAQLTQLNLVSAGVVSLVMDEASGSCTVWFMKPSRNSKPFAVAIKSDNSLSVQCTSPNTVTDTFNSVIFQGRSFAVTAGTNTPGNPDVGVVATDSAADPTMVSAYTVSATFLGSLATVPRLFPSQNGLKLTAIWDDFDGRFMPSPPWSGNEMSSIASSQSGDGVTWTAPAVFWAPIPADAYEAGTFPSGSGGPSNFNGGAGTAEVASASDLGSGSTGLQVWRFFQDDGTVGNAVYISTANQSNLVETGPNSNTPAPFSQEFLAAGWPVPFAFPVVTQINAQLIFQGVRRIQGTPPAGPKYCQGVPYVTPKSYTYVQQLTINTTGTFPAELQSAAPQVVTQPIYDYDFEWDELEITYSSAGTLPKVVTALMLYDPVKQQMSNIPVDDIGYNGAPFSEYKNGSQVPPMIYPAQSEIRVEVWSLVADASILPVTMTLHFVGKQMIPKGA